MPSLTRSSEIRYFSKNNPCISCGKKKARCYYFGENDSIGCYYTDSYHPPSGYFAALNQPKDGAVIFSKKKDQEKLTPEQLHQREMDKIQKAANLKEFQQAELNQLMPADQRDELIRRLSAELGLGIRHKKMLTDRGLTDQQIQGHLFFSIDSYQKAPPWMPFNAPSVYLSKYHDRLINHGTAGVAIVIINELGQATGWQVLNELPRPTAEDSEYKKYVWCGNSHLPGKDQKELPIQFTQTTASDIIWLCEGTLKPVVAAYRHGINTLGASSGNFAASPTLTIAALAGITRVVLPIDAGDLINEDRIRHWGVQVKFLELIGKTVTISWWGQETKAGGDIDEIADLQKVKNISFAAWLEKSIIAVRRKKERLDYQELSTCQIAPNETRAEPILSALPIPTPGGLQFVSSPVATGKTKQLEMTIANWLRINPNGRIFMLGYRNGLLDNAGDRLGIPSYRIGNGQEDFAIANYPKVRMCLDSLLRLKIEDVPSGSLIIFDEVEAILEHGATGGTLGNNAPSIQAHLLQIMHKVLSTGGAIIGLEDRLTDLSIKGLDLLLANKYPIELIVNTAERFKWEVRMGYGTKADIIALVIEALDRGENIAVPASSQKLAKLMARTVLALRPDLADKVVLLDSNAQDLTELKANPDKWLAENGTRLLIYTSAVESGFSIETYKFDQVIAWFANLTTRTHLQMLSRVRSNCPRSIFIKKLSAEGASVKATDPEKLLKMERLTAEKTSLAHGLGRIDTTAESAAWNLLIAQFQARANLSYKHSQDLLAADLESRGHQVQIIKWIDLVDSSGIKDFCPEMAETIEAEENDILFEADGRAITLAQAISIKHSSDSTFEQKQQAEKCLLHDRLPGVEFSKEFLLESVTRNRGAYLNACTLSFMCHSPELAYQLDGEQFKAQKEQPHIIYTRVPRLSQKVGLLAGIQALVEKVIADGGQYQNSTPEVEEVHRIALGDRHQWWVLFGILVAPTTQDSKGRMINTPIAIFNKVLKKLGYKNKLISDNSPQGVRIKIYAITNADCEHRATIMEGLQNKHAAQLEQIKENPMAAKKMTPKPAVDVAATNPELADLITVRDSLKMILSGTLEERRAMRAETIGVWGEAKVLAGAKLLSFENQILFNSAA
jgi:hypothetical protein